MVDRPAGATVLASTAGTPNQAFLIGDTVFATQFHLEADRPLLRDWLATPAMADDLTVEGRARLLDDYDAAADSLAASGRRMFNAFADAVSR